jgi:hypothetical protein
MNVTVRPLGESDLAMAGRIISLAFGTFVRVPEPEKFLSDKDYARTRCTPGLAERMAARSGPWLPPMSATVPTLRSHRRRPVARL